MKNKLFLTLAAGVIALSILACAFGGGNPPATQPPVVNPPITQPPVNPPADALEIISITSFTDDFGYFYIYGEVINTSDVAVDFIELLVQVLDANGNSLLVDENGVPVDSQPIYPMLSVLGPGDSSPFSFYLDTNTYGSPATYDILVGSYEMADVQKADLGLENVQMIDGGDGYLYLSGDLVNQTSSWVYIASLAGGALDDSNAVLSADWSFDYTSLLAPAGDTNRQDRTPFAVSFQYPPGNVTQWSVWWDAQVYEDDPSYPIVLNVTYTYFDDYGSAHLVGYVTNNGGETVNTSLVGGLYAEDGTCLDASYAYLPYAIKPGESVPFDITYFSNVNYNEQQAALVDTFTAQVDYWATYSSYFNQVVLASSDVAVTKSGSNWTVNGNFTNNSDKNILDAVIAAVVYDASDNIVGVGYTYVYPTGDNYAPGAGDAFEIYLYLDPGGDLANYRVEFTVFGEFE
jgi:hypothetical protein